MATSRLSRGPLLEHLSRDAAHPTARPIDLRRLRADDAFLAQLHLEAGRRAGESGWTVTATVRNHGTGRMPIDIAAVSGERFPEDDDGDAEPWQESRIRVLLGPDESETITFETDFEPARLTVDPDATVLMLKRELAEEQLPG